MTRKGEVQLKKGPERQAKALELAKLYSEGMSLRQIAFREQRSYTFAYELVKEGGATLRNRGGNRRISREEWEAASRKPDTAA